MGNINLRVYLTNRAATACVLLGYPRSLAGVTPGTVTPLRISRGSYFGDPGPAANIRHGQRAALNISSSDGCTTLRPGSARIFREYRVGLPGGGVIDVPSGGFPIACGVSVSQFGVPADQQPPFNPPPSPLTARIHAPATAHPGQDFRYLVTLTNPTDRTYRLAPCPSYEEYVSAMTKTGARPVIRDYYLNCRAIQQIPARASATFQMRLQLPDDLEAGFAKFGWYLQGDTGPYADAPLRIQR